MSKAKGNVNHFAPGASNISEKDDRLLLSDARAGNSDSFGTLVRRYQDELYRLAVSLVNVPHEAEDLVGEAFVRAWKHLRGFKGESSFKTWLIRILINASRSHLRRRYLHKKIFFWEKARDAGEEEREREFADDSAFADPEKRSHQSHLRAVVRAAKRDLSPRENEVFTLKFEQDMKIREISALLSLSPNTVKVLLFRAAKKMAKALKEEV